MHPHTSEIMDYIHNRPIMNTHSHHLDDKSFEGYDLDVLLRHTYVDWSGVPTGHTQQSRQAYLDRVRYKSYFVWLQKALQQLYGLNNPLSADHWEDVSVKIAKQHENREFHLDVLRQCRYEKVILDAYWEPGSDNGHPDLFSPTFRVDPFFYGYSADCRDHDGNNPTALYGEIPNDIDGYVAFLRELAREKKQQGCLALKCAIAYDRGLDFGPSDKEKASRVFVSKSPEHVAAFHNYLFQQVCELAAELGLALQCHTGMGQLTNTRAMAMKDAIEANPETKFVLFHCGFPWTGDISALLHAYQNVYPDLCWLPILSPTAAKRTLHELIEVGTSDKICWGCDTWTPEESLGALLAFEYVLGTVLGEKVRDGYFSIEDAMRIADKIMYDNAKALYKL